MHKHIVRAFATIITASLFAFPSYAQTTGTAKAVSIQHLDIVSITLDQVTVGVRKKEAAAKAAKIKKQQEAAAKAAELKRQQAAAASLTADSLKPAAQTSAETQAQTYAQAQTETQAQTYTETQAQTYTETQAQTYTETQAQTYTETQAQTETQAPVKTAKKQSSSSSSYSGQRLNATNGTVEGPSGTETYYNLNMSGVVSNMKSMGYDSEYWVRDDGVKMYGDYVMVAANLDTHSYGSVVDTSLGKGIVVDTGDFAASDSDQLDVAVNW